MAQKHVEERADYEPPNDHRKSLAVTYLDHLQHWAMQKEATAVRECQSLGGSSLTFYGRGFAINV